MWKEAVVTPIHKKGMKNNVANYRPISLTSVICRTMERILCNSLTKYFSFNHLQPDNQHGFVKKRSTLTQQLILLNNLTENFDNNITTEMIYLDYAKAFDSVPHNKLIHVLKHLKVNDTVVAWISNYLSNRSQRTVVDGFYSESCKITSGVPQGSVLAPLLFLTYTTDLLNQLGNQNNIVTYAFADDLKLSGTDSSKIQESLNIIEKWSNNWQLKIQPAKSEHIIFSTPRSNSTKNTYFLDNQIIKESDTVRDLGILINNDLKWATQISKIYIKSLHLVHNIIKSFKTKNPHVYVQLFKSYVRPLTEYNNNIWSSHLVSDVKKSNLYNKNFLDIFVKSSI